MNIGDCVLTHTGKYRKVVAKNRRIIDKDERVFEFQTFLGNKFRITEKHKILVSFGDKIKWVPVEDVPKNADIVFPIPKIYPNKKKENKLVLGTIDGYKKTFKLDNDFYRFLGYWIGDGYTNAHNRTNRIGLIFNKKDKNLLNSYKRIIKSKMDIRNISESLHGGAIYLYWTDRPLMLWLSKNFRNRNVSGWRGKSLPEWFWNISKKNFIEFIRGWIDSDGSVDNIGRTSITTKEKYLASFAQLIGLKFGMVFGVRRFTVNGGTYFKIIIPKNNKHSRIINNKLHVKILRKKELKRTGGDREIDPRARVFNIQVEKDESFCASFATLHNCAIHKKGDKLWFFTRRLENITKQFPELQDFARKAINANECIIEGEMLCFDKKTMRPLPFQSLSQRIKRKYDIEKMVEELPIKVNIFDITLLEGKELFDTKLEKRWEILNNIIKPITGKFELAKHLETKDLKKAKNFYDDALKASQEGLIVKNLDALYHPGRRVSGGWLKVKPIMETLDLVITGATWGTGKRVGWMGSFRLGARDSFSEEFLDCGMIGTGIKEKEESGGVTFLELTNLLKKQIIREDGVSIDLKPDVVVEVAYEEIQKSPTYSSGFALRFPRVVRIRPDKDASEADSLERIEKLYAQQKGKVG